MSDHKSQAAWKTTYPTTKDRVEFFSQRFPQVDRHKIFEVAEQFDKVATQKSPQELEQDQVQLFFERRGETMTAQSIKKLFVTIDEDKDSKVNILEILCAIFKTDWKHLHAASGDADAVDKLAEAKLAALKLQEAKEAEKNQTAHLSDDMKKLAEQAEQKKHEAEQQKAALEASLAAKKKEEDDKKHAEEEKKKASVAQGGAKGRAAMFDIAAHGTQDTTQSNAERIKKEAAERKAKQEMDKLAHIASEKAAELEKAAHEAAEKAAEVKKQAEEAERERKEAEEKAEAAAAAKKLRDEFLAAKAKEDEEKKHKAEEEKKKQEESKARLAAKAAAFK